MGQATSRALAEITDAAALTDDDVAGLRRAVYQDGEVGADEIRAILHLHRDGATRSPAAAWADFFVEAVADYYALQREAPIDAPSYAPDYTRAAATALRALSPIPAHKIAPAPASYQPAPLSASDTAALILAFRAESGVILDPLERRALARLFDRVVELSEPLKRFALDAVYATVRDDGRIDADEVRLLRRVLYGPAGEEGLAISRQEAELLFAIAGETREADNACEWREFFVKAVTSYLLFAGATPEIVDGGEAAWLVAKLGRPEAMAPLRRALISYVAREAQQLDPRLKPYLDELS